MFENTTVVIPTYNERRNIAMLVSAISERHRGIHIIVVDDNSPDGTAAIVESLQDDVPNVTLLKRPHKEGLASAYMDAFQEVLGGTDAEYIVTMDADWSHDPRDVQKLLEKAPHCDVAVGSRYVSGGVTENRYWLRRVGSACGNAYLRSILRMPIMDLTAGFVVYKRRVLETILGKGVRSIGYAFQFEMKYLAYASGATFIEVPITFRERAAGQSKLNKRIIMEAVIAPWRLRLVVPPQ